MPIYGMGQALPEVNVIYFVINPNFISIDYQ